MTVPQGIPAGERRLLIAAIVSAGLGVAALASGYWGASGTRDLSAQIPYVISGGLVGVALIFTAAILFARYSLARLARFWLARLLAEQRTQTDRIVAALESREPPPPPVL
jgi:uncharacterized membrane protein YdcZ (DUF606 family)